MKKNKEFLIIGLILLLLLVVGTFIFIPKLHNIYNIFFISSHTNSSNGALSSLKIQAQTYLATQVPQFKANDQILGSPQAPLKVFVYEDYTNIFSANLAATLNRIKNNFKAKVAIVVRPYYRNSALAFSAASAVDCAGGQGKWAQMRNLLFSQTRKGQLSKISFSSDARQLALNLKSFNFCLTKNRKLGTIQQYAKDSIQSSLQGVPTMFIGREMILGARPYDNYIDSRGDKIEGLKELVAKQLQLLN